MNDFTDPLVVAVLTALVPVVTDPIKQWMVTRWGEAATKATPLAALGVALALSGLLTLVYVEWQGVPMFLRMAIGTGLAGSGLFSLVNGVQTLLTQPEKGKLP